MEHNTHSGNIDILESQIRECFARVAWSHKTQEKCADIMLNLNKKIKFWQILLSVLTTTGILFTIFGNNNGGAILGGIFSATLIGLNMYTKDYDLAEISQKHSNSATELWNIRESYLSLLVDIKTGQFDMAQLKVIRDSLQNELFHIYKGSPRTISKAYNEATKALKENEELTFSDKEIDVLLPINLRKNM